jgi:hypothetical protein
LSAADLIRCAEANAEEVAMRRAMVGMATGLAMLGLGACAYDEHGRSPGEAPYGDYAYRGSDWAGTRRPYQGELRGPGLAILDPWLRETREGRAIVTLGFRDSAGGFVSEEVAHRASIWFRRYADSNRDMELTDPEIRVALVQAAGRYSRPAG